MLALLIVACEVGFWVFVAAGLVFRYMLNLPRMGLVLLACTPLLDLALLAAAAIDLQGGSEAGFVHSLSAIYLGVSIVYGKRMIRWADERFVHRFKGGPKPAAKPKYGAERARHERMMWLHHLLAWAIGCCLMLGMIWWIGDESRTEALSQTMKVWSAVLAIDFVVSMSYTIWPKPEKST